MGEGKPMNEIPDPDDLTSLPRGRRQQMTKSEGLLWSILRGRQVCGLKFRREHPIAPYQVDFACVAERLVVEVDGGYHDGVGEADLRRQQYLQRAGWRVIRFTDREVAQDPEVVARGIAGQLGREYSFQRRAGGGSGSKSTRAKPPKKK